MAGLPDDYWATSAFSRRNRALEARFMSRRFAEMLQIEMLRDPINRNIIHAFYPEMEKTSFLDGLPDYGKQWKHPANF